ncbi:MULTISPECIES: DUF58 domain-containing protein [unclassified Planococcus (in: firmicutes)]|uniref:DUF58 domain-containing protein n=1 Tax=unclassified Planococcus (in: firmicutes) TaxID=2662419 RepID=UPI0020B2CBB4|nr:MULTISPECIES: DUF58 domain-containing protein [unclassified Planococcus (in: firmicutes)]
MIFVLILLFLTFSFAMFQGGFVSWFVFYVSVPFILYSVLLSFYPLQNLRAERVVHTPRVRNGHRFSATVTVRRTFPFPLLYTVLEEQAHSARLKVRMAEMGRQLLLPGFRREFSWTYEIEEMPRGEHVLEGVLVETADFFGWVKKRQLLPVRQSVLVYPNTVEMMYRPIGSSFDQGSIAAPFTLVKDTTMASGIRDYQPGDRVSWIHWKSFARTQTMRTKEFEDRQSQDLFLLDDRSPSPVFELQVELIASILTSVVASHASVAYLSAGTPRAFFPLIQSEKQLQRALYHLAKVQDDLDRPIEAVVGQDLKQVHVPSLVYVTGSLSREMVDEIRRNATSLSQCLCLVVTEAGQSITPEDEKNHQYASSKGFRVKVVGPGNFASAFMEANRS